MTKSVKGPKRTYSIGVAKHSDGRGKTIKAGFYTRKGPKRPSK